MSEHVLNDTNRHLEMVTIFAENMEVVSLETQRKLQVN